MPQKKIQHIATVILPLLKRSGITKAGIFGSYARGEENRNSDVDILIKVNPKKSLLDIVHLQLKLKEQLGKEVDLLEYAEIHPYLKKRILSDEVRIL